MLFRETDYFLRLVRLHGNTISKTYLLIYRETISILIDKGHSTRLGSDDDRVTTDSLYLHRHSETIHFHRALQSYWLGHSERCQHYVEKLLQMKETDRNHKIIIMFYHGLNSFQLLKRSNTAKLRSISKDAISTLKAASEHSRWNYRNKMYLLEAELFSFEGKKEEASASYAAAITASRSSRFVHELGLSCELAGFHYEKIGDLKRSWDFFNRAKQCYTEWGSQMKVDFITCQMDRFQVKFC